MIKFKNSIGFTLIEVLIALAILSIALTAIIQAASQNVKSTIYLQDKTIANWIALTAINEAKIDLIKLPEAPENLEQEKEVLGQRFVAKINFNPTPNSKIQEIHVEVLRKIDKAVLIQKTGFKRLES